MILKLIMNYIPIDLNQRGVLNIKGITKKNIPLFLFWILIILWIETFAMQKIDTSLYLKLIGIYSGNIYFYIYAIIAGVLIFFLNNNNIHRYTACGALTAFIGYLAFILFQSCLITKIFLVISAIGFGVVFASGCYSYVMILNNAEKFFSMVIGFILARGILLIKIYYDSELLKSVISQTMPCILLAGLTICAFLAINAQYKFDEAKEKSQPPLGVYSVLFIVVARFILNEGVALAVLRTTDNIIIEDMYKLYAIGALVGIMVVIILQPIFKCSLWHIWNIAFAILALGFIINILAQMDINFARFSAILYGSSYSIIYMNIFYMTGIMVKKYKSILFLQICVLTAAISDILSYKIFNYIISSNSVKISILAVFSSIVIILIFFMLSPLFVKELYSAEWMDDMYKIDVTYGGKLTERLKEYSLSPREIEVGIMLLEGFTMRQIAATLSIAYPTVNTYCVNIYRKLNINSRTELLVMFSEYIKK